MNIPALTPRLVFVALLGASIVTAPAADRYKANNATALNLAGSWTNNAVPTSADLAIFDSTLNGSISSYALGGSLTWGGISFRDAASAQTISATSGATLTLANGSSGIAMTSAATTDFNIACLVSLGSAGGQTLNVANSDRTLTMSGVISGTGPLTKTGNGTLKLSSAHTYTGGTVISGGVLKVGSHNTLPAGNVTVQSGATLDLNAFGLTNKANYVIHIAGTGVGDAGALVDNVSGQLNFALTNLVLDADAYVGGVGRFDMRPITASQLPPTVDLAGHTLTKVGANQFWWQQPSVVTDGNIVVQAGILGLSSVPLTGNGTVTIKNTAELRLFRSTGTSSVVTRPLSLEAGALLSYTGQNTADAIDQSIGSAVTLAGDASVSVSTAGAVFELAGAISGSGGLTKTGAGSLLLSGASTYSGATVVSAGTLTLSSVWNGSGAVTVNDGGTLEAQPSTLNGTLNLNSLSLGTVASTTLSFNLGGFANPTNPVVYATNAVTLIGTTTVNLSGTTGLTSGTVTLLTFGTIGGGGSFQLGVTPGFTATLATNGNSLVVTLSPLALAWRGETGGVPLGDWVTTNPQINTNWLNVLANTPTAYADGNAVVFDESLTGTASVNIPATVSPASVTVSNQAAAYSFSGSGKISGPGGLAKTGSGTLTLGLTNDYAGATTIAQGKVKLAISEAIPSGSLTPPLTVNGTLDLNGNNQTAIGLNGAGVVDNTSASAPATLLLTGAGSFSGTIQNSGSSDSAPLGLKKTTGQVQILTSASTFSGGALIQGALQVGSDQALGSGQIWMSYVGALSSDSATPHSFTNSLKLDGGNVTTLGNSVNTGVLTFSGPITLNGGNRTVNINSEVVFNGNVDSGSLTKQGNGTLIMNGLNTYTGTTTVSAGTLAGTGTFPGKVTISASAALAPGNHGIGTLTVSNQLVLNSASTTYMELSAANNTGDLVQGLTSVTYGGTLQVTNLSGTFTNGQSFSLFSATTPAGSFAATNLPPLGTGLAWNWIPTSGTLAVVSAMATTPTNISFVVQGGNLTLTWPASHLGWYAQSNSVDVGDVNSWFNIPNSDSATTLSISIDPATPKVFYRLRKP